MKIIVGVNTLTSVDTLAYSNHCQMWFRFGRGYQDIDFILNHPRRMSIDNMRNMTAKVALDNNCDYILFLDDDVLVPIDGLRRLLQCEADIAAGWTIIRGYPFKNMFFRFQDEAKTQLENWSDPVEEGILKCDAVGFSFALIKVDLLRKVKPPYFVTGPYNTEDIYFCMKVRQSLPDATIVVDTSVKTSHILGPELIDPLSKELYKDYYEKLFPEAANYKEGPVENKFDESDGISYEDLLGQVVFGDK